MEEKMYYLDFHQLYKRTTTRERVAVRNGVAGNRGELMARRLKSQHNQCFYCGAPVTMRDHLDHVIPVYYGGTNKLRNLVVACRGCNEIKKTDQIEITNEHTIRDYLRLKKAHSRVKDKKYKNSNRRYQLHQVYRADLFKEI